MALELSENGRSALRFIRDYRVKSGYSPSLREISAGVGLSSASSAGLLLRGLADLGLILVDGGKSRSARLTEEGEKLCGGSE